jgi:NAD(P)-dependent dehydrogenase (short-subunit alcohol dehydrogenase family)
VALITGAGTGIGRAISKLFACEGALIALNYRRSHDGAEEVASRIRSNGGGAISIAGDVSREVEVRSMVAQTHAEFGRLDILVNNAGWSESHSPSRASNRRGLRGRRTVFGRRRSGDYGTNHSCRGRTNYPRGCSLAANVHTGDIIIISNALQVILRYQ